MRKLERWPIETGHRTMKQYYGAEHFHVWSKQSVSSHLYLCFLAAALAGIERLKRFKKGNRCTGEALFWENFSYQPVASS